MELGFNATVPHKAALIPLLDEIAPDALAANSVNTVINRNGRLYGESTDGYGLETALYEALKLNISGAKNAALPLVCASLLTADEVTLKNVPNLSDITFLNSLLQFMGLKVEKKEDIYNLLVLINRQGNTNQNKQFHLQLLDFHKYQHPKVCFS